MISSSAYNNHPKGNLNLNFSSNKNLKELGLSIDDMLKKKVTVSGATKCNYSSLDLIARRHNIASEKFKKSGSAKEKVLVMSNYVKEEFKEMVRVIKSKLPHNGPPGDNTPMA